MGERLMHSWKLLSGMFSLADWEVRNSHMWIHGSNLTIAHSHGTLIMILACQVIIKVLRLIGFTICVGLYTAVYVRRVHLVWLSIWPWERSHWNEHFHLRITECLSRIRRDSHHVSRNVLNEKDILVFYFEFI